MTTDTDEKIDAAEVWRAIGRLESDTSTLKDGQSEIKADFQQGQSEIKADFQQGQSELREDMRELNRRMDRMFYTILAVGGALFVAIFASNFIGN